MIQTFISILLTLPLIFGPTARPKPVWADEFNYSGVPDDSKWTYQLGNGCPDLCGWGNNEIQHYTNDPQNVRVENGTMVIEAKKVGERWTSARVTSKGRKNFSHGRLEIRAKLPAGKGTWPALWMLGESIDTKGWPKCGEIDIMEHVGRNPGIVQAVVHTGAVFGNTHNKDTIIVQRVSEKFHVYTMDWKKDRIEFGVDGVVFYTYRPDKLEPDHWPFSEPQYLLMNVAMGGNLGGSDIDPKLTSARMEIDYVRYYQ